MDEITPETLAALAAGDLPDAEARALRDRIDADPDGRERLAATEQLAAFLRDESAIEIPDAAVRRAKSLLAKSRPGMVDRLAGRAAEGVRTFLAALDFDSRLAPALTGFRGVSEVVQVAFSAEPCEIDLELEPAGDGRTGLRGQIDADPPSDESERWTVAFVDADGRTIATADGDADGVFRTDLPDGSFTLVCARGDLRVEAGPLNIP